MSKPRTRRSLDRALGAIQAHFRDTGRPPSLSDLGRRLGCSRDRASKLVAELGRRGLITHEKGEPFSIRLAEPDPLSMHSDDEVIGEARRRGLVDWGLARAIGDGLAAAPPMTRLQLPRATPIGDDMLGRGIGEGGAVGEAEEEGRTAAGVAPRGDSGAGGAAAAARDPPGRGGGGASRRAA